MRLGNFSLAGLLLIADTTCRVESSIPPPPPPPLEARQNVNVHKTARQYTSDRPPQNPLRPPPPPAIVDEKRKATTNSISSYSAPLVEKNQNELPKEYDQDIVESDDYTEEITTREQAEHFSKAYPPPPQSTGIHRDRPNVNEIHDESRKWENYNKKNKFSDEKAGKPPPGPPPPRVQESETKDTSQQTSSVIEETEDQWSGKLSPQKDERSEGYSDQRPESKVQAWDENEQKPEQEWIVPKENQFQPQQPDRLHKPYPRPPPSGPGRIPGSFENDQMLQDAGPPHLRQIQHGQYMPRTYPQRPYSDQQPPARPLAPRNYNYSRGPPLPQQPHHDYRHHQYGPGHGALVPRSPQQPPGSSLFQRFGRSLDALADVDTLIQKKAQQVMKTVSSSSENVAGTLSGAMRKTVFQSIDGVSGIKEGIKDKVKGGMSNIFGGAPTSATETAQEWNDDRIRSVRERRRKAIIGTSGEDRGGPGETFVGSGESPLQQQFNVLAQKTDVTQDSNMNQEHMQQQPNEESAPERQESDSMNHGAQEIDGSIIQPRQTGNKQISELNPYAILAYPAGKDQGEDDSSDIEGNEDVIDPATFFGPSQAISTSPRSAPPASFEFQEDKITLSRKIGSLFKIPSFVNRRRNISGLIDASGWSDDEWVAQSTNIPKRVPAPIPKLRTKSAAGNSKEDLLMRYLTSSPVARKATANLLSSSDIQALGKIGRSKAVMDLLTLTFIYITALEILKAFRSPFEAQSWRIPTSIDDGMMVLQQITSTLSISDVSLVDTWAPFTFIASILSFVTRDVLFNPKSKELMRDISNAVKLNVLQSQLFLRLESGMLLRKELEQTLSKASEDQSLATIEIARLRAFAFAAFVALVIATVPVVKPMCMNVCVALIEMFSYEGLREWPVDWDALGSTLKDLAMVLMENLKVVFDNELDRIISNPMAIMSTLTIAVALFIFSQLSIFERGRSTTAAKEGIQMPIISNAESYQADSSVRISNLGESSASRLELKMQEGAVEKMLHQFQLKTLLSRTPRTKPLVNKLKLRKFAYNTICAVLTLVPILVHVFIAMVNESNIDLEQFSGIILALLFTNNIAKKTIFAAIESTRNLTKVAPFLKVLSDTTQEVESKKGGTSTRTSSSPGKGLVISDLWAAHSAKRYVNAFKSMHVRINYLTKVHFPKELGRARVSTYHAKQVK